MTKTFSILPNQFVTETLTSACDDFRMTFVKELVVLTQREEYLSIVDEMIAEYLSIPEATPAEEHFEQCQNKFRAFFT